MPPGVRALSLQALGPGCGLRGKGDGDVWELLADNLAPGSVGDPVSKE